MEKPSAIHRAPLQVALPSKSSLSYLQGDAGDLRDMDECSVAVLHSLCLECSKASLLEIKQVIGKGKVELNTLINQRTGDNLLHTTLRLTGLHWQNNNNDTSVEPVANYHPLRPESVDPRFATDYLERVLKGVQLLLKAGCSPTQLNFAGETPIQVALRTVHGTLVIEEHCRTLPPDLFVVYVLGLNDILQAFEDFKEHSTHPTCPGDLCPCDKEDELTLYIKILADYPLVHLQALDDGVFQRGIRLLCSNLTHDPPEHSFTLVYALVARWSIRTVKWAPLDHRLVHFLSDVFKILSSKGLAIDKFMADNFEPILLLPGMSRFVLSEKFWQEFYDFLRAIIREGGNPNTLKWSGNDTLENEEEYPDHLSLPVNICRVLAFQYQEESSLTLAFDLVLLLLEILKQTHLHAVTYTMANDLLAYSAMSQTPELEKIAARVRVLGTEPRRLCQLTKITVYEAMGWQIRRNIHKLPLPTSIREEMYNIHYFSYEGL